MEIVHKKPLDNTKNICYIIYRNRRKVIPMFQEVSDQIADQ